MGGTISGERGTGKSTYAYKVLAKTYYELNGYTKVDEEEDAYKEALKYLSIGVQNWDFWFVLIICFPKRQEHLHLKVQKSYVTLPISYFLSMAS